MRRILVANAHPSVDEATPPHSDGDHSILEEEEPIRPRGDSWFKGLKLPFFDVDSPDEAPSDAAGDEEDSGDEPDDYFFSETLRSISEEQHKNGLVYEEEVGAGACYMESGVVSPISRPLRGQLEDDDDGDGLGSVLRSVGSTINHSWVSLSVLESRVTQQMKPQDWPRAGAVVKGMERASYTPKVHTQLTQHSLMMCTQAINDVVNAMFCEQTVDQVPQPAECCIELCCTSGSSCMAGV